jgi:hypothetical protein
LQPQLEEVPVQAVGDGQLGAVDTAELEPVPQQLLVAAIDGPQAGVGDAISMRVVAPGHRHRGELFVLPRRVALEQLVETLGLGGGGGGRGRQKRCQHAGDGRLSHALG